MGLGLVMHIFAKIVFVLVGYGIHMYLAKTLSPYDYGCIGVILSIININYNFLSNGVRQTGSHLLATGYYDGKEIIKKSYLYQFIISIILFFINFLGAEKFAYILNRPMLAPYIRMTAIIIPFTAMYFMNVGILNGYKFLTYEATVVTIYPLARLSIIPLVAFVFDDSLFATISGFFIAAVVGCFVGFIFIAKKVKPIQKNETISHFDFFKLIIDFLAFFSCVTVILNLDMLFVNALVSDGNQVGYYTGATNLSKISYYLLSAIYLVALPLVTHSYNEGDKEKSKKTIQTLFLIIVGLILPIISIAGPICSNLLEFFYTADYRQAAIPTEVLMCSQFLLGMFVVINVLICATQSKIFSVKIGCLVCGVDIALCLLFIPQFGLLGAALSSFLSNLCGVIITFKKLISIFGHLINKPIKMGFLMNILCFLIMTAVNLNWNSTSMIQTILICIFAYSIFVFIIVKCGILPLSTLITLFRKTN